MAVRTRQPLFLTGQRLPAISNCAEKHYFNLNTARAMSALIRAISAHWERVGILAESTAVNAEPALLSGVGSSSGVLATVAVLANVPKAGGVMTSVIVAVPPLAIAPRVQVTVVVPEQLPCDGVAETNVVPAGRMSVTTTFDAVSGPALLTVMV